MSLFDYFKKNDIYLNISFKNRLLQLLGLKLDNKDYRQLSLEHIALLTIFTFTCDIFSQAKLQVIDKDGQPIENDPLLLKMKNPNMLQTQSDFMYQHLWYKMLGANYIWTNSLRNPNDISRVNALFNLYFGDCDFKTTRDYKELIISEKGMKTFMDLTIDWNYKGKKHKVPISQIIPYYDISNNMEKDRMFESPSRVKGILKTLEAISTNLESKNNALSFSDKYLVSNKSQYQGMPKSMHPDDKMDIETSVRIKDIMATNADVTVNNLSPDFRKLLLDDLYASDFIRVAAAFGMPKDVLNIALNSSTTYENQNQSFINWLQTKVTSELDNFTEGINSHFGYEDNKLIATIDHLPAMQESRESKAKSFSDIAKGIGEAVQAGLVSLEDGQAIIEKFKP